MLWIHFNRRSDEMCMNCKCTQYVYGIDACNGVSYGQFITDADTLPICMNCGIWTMDLLPLDSYWEQIVLRGYNELQRSPKRNDVEIYIQEDEY